MSKREWIGLWFVVGLVSACGSEEPKATPCPQDVAAGQMLACECPDDDTRVGITVCTDAMELTACDCSDPMPVAAPASMGAADASPPPASGGAEAPSDEASTPPPAADSGSGASGAPALGGDPIAGDAGGDAGAGDAGAGGEASSGDKPDGGAGDESPSDQPRPTDGTQLAVCDSGSDCAQGFECYMDAPGQSYCTKVCSSDPDCEDVEGADYTCAALPGVCRVVCDGADDDVCPAGQTCRWLNPLAGYRCAYPD